MAYNWNAIQAGARPAQQGPGLGQQFAEKAATKIATDQVAKLGLGAAGTAIGGPLGGAAGSALGELAGPLAGKLAGSLFMEGGPVYLAGGGQKRFDPNDPAIIALLAKLQGLHFQPPGDLKKNATELLEGTGAKIEDSAGGGLNITPSEGSAQEEVKPAPVVSPRSKSSAQWDIPLGSGFLGADWSTSGSYSDMDRGKDPWSAGIKGTWSFNKGGDVPSNSIWDSVKKAASYAWKNDNKPGDRWAEKNKKPQYKAIGGMTPGPLGMSDMMVAGKDKSISKVKLKKAKGDMSEEMEYSYHPPLAAKPTGE